MTDETTPTDEQVKQDWISARITESDYWYGMPEEEAEAQWARWMAKHDAAVEAAVLRKFADHIDLYERGDHHYITDQARDWAESAEQ